MVMDPQKLLNWPFEDLTHTYSKRDTMLYALGLGFGADPTDGNELQYVYEENLSAVPSMAVVLGYPGFWLKHPDTGVNWQKILHGEQFLEIFEPIPAEGTVIGRMKVDGIIDKGADKGAIIYSSREIINQANDTLLAKVSMSVFCRGDGGCGSTMTDAPKPHALPDGPCNKTCEITTLPQSALIYRLSGDYNPLHADPEVARSVGFDRPILHGLATYGIAARAILKSCCDYDASKLKALNVRFSAPVYPGETVRVDIWQNANEISFRASAVERDVVVLNNGYARLA